MGFVEASAIAKIYGAKHDYLSSPNRELVAFGIANLVGSIFGAFPTFASLPRSAVGDAAGVKTQFAGVVVFILIALTQAFLLPLFASLPKGEYAVHLLVTSYRIALFEIRSYVF